jgi:hypothetical protein
MAASVTESLPITIPNVPCLEPSSSNWAIFSMCFQEAMQANQKWGHFDGMSVHPVPKDLNAPEATEVKEMANWDHSKTIVCYMLSQWLLDSTTVCLKNVTKVSECWTRVKGEFSMKSQYVEVNILTSFTEMCCPGTADVCSFLGLMCIKHEELVAIRVTISDKDYQSTILKAVLEEMLKFTSNLLTASWLFWPSKSIDPDVLIDHISEEADCLCTWWK